MTEQTIDELIEDVIEREGGYVDHPADRGGPTRWGITEAVARRSGYLDDMRMLPACDAAAIYKRLYWIAPNFDRVAEMAPTLAGELFDTGINMGTGTATGFLQRALNALNRNGRDYGDIAVDRRIGPATMRALHAFFPSARQCGRGGVVEGHRSFAGRTLCSSGRNPAFAGGFSIWLAREPHWIKRSFKVRP